MIFGMILISLGGAILGYVVCLFRCKAKIKETRVTCEYLQQRLIDQQQALNRAWAEVDRRPLPPVRNAATGKFAKLS
jgi:hypothetical protein